MRPIARARLGAAAALAACLAAVHLPEDARPGPASLELIASDAAEGAIVRLACDASGGPSDARGGEPDPVLPPPARDGPQER